MTKSDLLYSVESTPTPESQLPQCAEEMYTCIANPHRFRVALAAEDWSTCINRTGRISSQSLQDTGHCFEVCKKDVYALLWGEKYSNTKKVKEEPTGSPKVKKAKTETIAKSACRVLTTLVAPSSAADLTAAGRSKQ